MQRSLPCGHMEVEKNETGTRISRDRVGKGKKMFIVYGIIILLSFVLGGFFTWAASDLPLALREIAINSRPAGRRGSAYSLLRILSIILRITACLIWLTGIVVAFLVALYTMPSSPLQFSL